MKYDDVRKAYDETMLISPEFKEMVTTVYSSAKDGAEVVKGNLTEKLSKYQRKLDQMSETKPNVVGMVDGFTHVYLDTQTSRVKGNEIYNRSSRSIQRCKNSKIHTKRA